MDENTKEYTLKHNSKYNISIKYIFDRLENDIRKLLGVDDISKKSRELKYIKARSLFINIINDKYGINVRSKPSNSIFTTSIIGQYLNIDRTSVYHNLTIFNSLLQYSNSFRAIYNSLRDKWVKDKDYSELRKEIKILRGEIESINKKFDEIYNAFS